MPTVSVTFSVVWIVFTPCSDLNAMQSRVPPDLITDSDVKRFLTCLHLAVTCVFPYLDNLPGYKSHFNTNCKWNVCLFLNITYMGLISKILS